MSDCANLDLTICQGKTFSKVLRWGQPKKAYKAITGASKAAPCVLTVVGHGVPEGWLFKIHDVAGMTDLNSENRSENNGYYAATVASVDSIELNDVNASGFRAYTSGGVIAFNEPVDLTGFSARMQIRRNINSDTVLMELTTENDGIVLDNTAKTITLNISATDTAAIDWTAGEYEIEMISSGGVVSSLAKGGVKVSKEATR